MDIELKITKRQVILAVGVSLVSGIFLLAVQSVLYFNLQYEKSLIEKETLTKVLGIERKDPFENLALSAKAYLVWDVKEQKIIASFNEEIQLPLASLAKLMTTYVVSNNIKEGSILTIQEENLKKENI